MNSSIDPIPMNTPKTPKEKALSLLADLATAQADLKAAVSSHEAEATRIQAAITKATAKEKARIAELEEELKSLALEHGPEIFGTGHRSLIENGLRLLVTESEAVELLGEEEDICRRIYRALQDSTDSIEKVALSSLLSVKLAINKRYVLDNFHKAPEWFEHYGINIEEKENASVKPAPKPRSAKSKASKKAPEELEQEAA